MQVKLLRFLQEKTFSRVGSNRELHADVRFIAATSRNLEELMAANKFRKTWYYRLNIFPIVMPDLSKRKGDVMLLAEHFLSKFNLKYGKDIKRLSTPAINHAHGLPLARQRPGAGKLHGTCRHYGAGRLHLRLQPSRLPPDAQP